MICPWRKWQRNIVTTERFWGGISVSGDGRMTGTDPESGGMLYKGPTMDSVGLER
jgi:hypothetical protein